LLFDLYSSQAGLAGISQNNMPLSIHRYSMTGKLGGHAGPIMTVLERRRDNDTLVFTGSRDHFVKACAITFVQDVPVNIYLF
jgi:hypothetical protein